MNEQILARKDLIALFQAEQILDTSSGWVYNGYIVDIVAIHEIESKYLQDITRSKTYKIVPKQRATNIPNQTPIAYDESDTQR